MSYQITRPDTDQLRFTSSKTGAWVLEDYLENAELGNLTLQQLLLKVLDTNGNVDVGNLRITLSLNNVDNTSDANKPISTATQAALNTKQDALVSATNLKTFNGQTLLGSGDIFFSGTTFPLPSDPGDDVARSLQTRNGVKSWATQERGFQNFLASSF